jgi:CheY-like chemotaxis protein
MHGGITLDSHLGSGTVASFWIPFNKPQFVGNKTPLVDIASLSERLQSELSISGCDSDPDRIRNTPPQSPLEAGQIKGKLSKDRPQPSPVQKKDQDKLDPSERRRIHVLIVEDNAINQQIAIKTVKKLGFSVSAVWNGKEALDYLLQEPTDERPRPDIILMDVQMPILDGYRATHIIRHHQPYTSLPGIRETPIVAMTASAIQGDREKCERAGMDDYLAKPVRSNVLETMLIKWAIRAKSEDGAEARSFKSQHTDHDSNCSDWPASPNFRSIPHKPVTGSTLATSPMTLDQIPVLETEGDRGLRRAAAEEKAVELRNTKLLNAAADQDDRYHQIGSSSELASIGPSPSALTEANIEKLSKQRELNDLPSPKLGHHRDSLVTRGASDELSSEPTISPSNARNSEQSLPLSNRDRLMTSPLGRTGRIGIGRAQSSNTVIKADIGKDERS